MLCEYPPDSKCSTRPRLKIFGRTISVQVRIPNYIPGVTTTATTTTTTIGFIAKCFTITCASTKNFTTTTTTTTIELPKYQ